MSMARLVVLAVRVEGRSQSEVARDYGLSRRWVHELVKRYDTHGDAGLEPRSRRPKSNPRQTGRDLEDEIVTLRKELDDLGLDAGAATIAVHLQRRHGTSPSISTIWRVLTRRGFVTPQPAKRPKSSFTRFQADQPNERWQADTTHWQLADNTDIEILNIIDDHSRLAITSTVKRTFKAADVVAVFDTGFARYGLPATILTDNAAIFTGTPRRKGQVALERHCALLGIRLTHGRPYHPQTQGKVERFHQTMKKWLAAHDPSDTTNQLQHTLNHFLDYYNTNRPHRALDRATPTQAFHARPAAQPDPTIGTPHTRIRHDIVNNGTVTLRHNSKLHHIGIGKAHTGTRVILLIADLNIRIINPTTGELLRQLTLDPTRDYQPRGAKPGPQKR